MVVDPQTIFVERLGKMLLTGCRFTDDDSVRAVIERRNGAFDRIDMIDGEARMPYMPSDSVG